jgi:hypothetical protein
MTGRARQGEPTNPDTLSGGVGEAVPQSTAVLVHELRPGHLHCTAGRQIAGGRHFARPENGRRQHA